MKHKEHNFIQFTFHYGSIQIIYEAQGTQFYTNLHSTMVLFKYDTVTHKLYPNTFTFHYGSIQI